MWTCICQSVRCELLRVICVMWCVSYMQVFGLFAVAVTATGSLYFLDDSEVAKKDGLTAAGALLCILNMAFVAVISMLISKRDGPTVIKWAVWSKHIVVSHSRRGSWLKSRRSNSSTSINRSVSRSSSVQLGLLSRVLSHNQIIM